jgi:excisionase family DNA binding protein
MAEKFYDVPTAAQVLGLKHETMRRWLRSGKVRAVRLGRDWRISERAIDELAHTATNQPKAPRKAADANRLIKEVRAPLTSDESARRLAALDALGEDAPDHRAEANLPPLDLSGEREDVYGYSPREDAQR